MQPRIHLGTQILLNPRDSSLRPFALIHAAEESLYACCVTGEAQEVVGGELDEKVAIDDTTVKTEDPPAHIESQHGIADPSLGAAHGI